MRAATEGGSLGFRTPQITIQYTSAVHQICQDLSMSLLTTAEIWRRKDGLSKYDVTKDVHSRMQRGCLLVHTHLQRSVCSYLRYG